MTFAATKHCAVRNQQRCLPPIVHEWLSTYGSETHTTEGAVIVEFTRQGIRRMEKALGRHFLHENKKYLQAYRVERIMDGRIITAGWRTKKSRRALQGVGRATDLAGVRSLRRPVERPRQSMKSPRLIEVYK